jgi:hypothetical protein
MQELYNLWPAAIGLGLIAGFGVFVLVKKVDTGHDDGWWWRIK